MITLMYAGNYKVFDGLVISALSAVNHVSEPLDVILLTMDYSGRNPDYLPLTERHRAALEEIYRRANAASRVRIIDTGTLYREVMEDSPNAETSYTPYTFLRLFADRIPEIPDKVLYLDTDTVICRDILPLWNTDISEYELGAVPDYYGRIFMGHNYFNAGVLLLNMREIRRTGLFGRAARMCAERKIFLPDQTALNRLVKKKLLLPVRYNEQKHYPDDTVIQHFAKTILWFPCFHTRNIKPWQTELVSSVLTHKYDALLSDYRREIQQINKRQETLTT